MKRLIILLFLFSATASAEPVRTNVTVHVVARDAKLLYDAVGGAWVTIADAATGEILAEGLHSGKSSGSTQAIMINPRKRGEAIFGTPEAAGFTAAVPLDRPTVVRISAAGPRGFPQATAAASKELLLVPGEHITGDGIVLELHGLIVNVQQVRRAPESVDVTATVQMACGCRLETDGIWNANEFKASATLIGKDGRAMNTLPMRWSEGRWIASFPRPSIEPAAVEVIASHAPSANFGRHKLELE